MATWTRSTLLLLGLAALACKEDSGGDYSDDTYSTSTDSDGGDGDGDTGDGDGDGDTGDGDGDGECLTPLPDDPELVLGFVNDNVELNPGGSYQYQVGSWECCVFWEPLETCSVYSVEPVDAGATIDPETGLLEVDASTPDGSTFTVTADIEDGLATVSGDVFVFVPELHPLIGYYTEVARIPCGGGPEFQPSDPIGELVFTASGEIRVTWTPFEIYVDYWGTYTHDLDTSALSILPTGGNYLPDDIDGEGSFSFEGDELVLHDIWLGTSQSPVEPTACGHRFQ
jgi:hypothetical protein